MVVKQNKSLVKKCIKDGEVEYFDECKWGLADELFGFMLCAPRKTVGRVSTPLPGCRNLFAGLLGFKA